MLSRAPNRSLFISASTDVSRGTTRTDTNFRSALDKCVSLESTSASPPHSSSSGSYIELKQEIKQPIINRLLSVNSQISFTTSSLHAGKQQFFYHVPVSIVRLLPLPAPAPPASSGGGPGAGAALRGAGRDVDLSLLDLAAGLRQQVLDLLLRLQVEHHVPELLLQIFYGHVLQIPCREKRRGFGSV